MTKAITKKQIIFISLLTFLNCFSISSLVATFLIPAQITLAQVPQTTLSLSLQTNESYESFVSRAEKLAKITIQNWFNQDQSLGELRVVIVGENEGAIAPILSLTISRQRWEIDPNIQRRATYFVDSKPLLGFDQEKSPSQPEEPHSPANNSQNPSPPKIPVTPLINEPPAESKPTSNPINNLRQDQPVDIKTLN